MAAVEVRQSGQGKTLAFEVTVTEGGGDTSHNVTIDGSHFVRLRRDEESPEQFIERCFDFLLARESKEAIMGSFDVSVISRFFPEFEEEISQ